MKGALPPLELGVQIRVISNSLVLVGSETNLESNWITNSAPGALIVVGTAAGRVLQVRTIEN
jgi:hypothetical protein